MASAVTCISFNCQIFLCSLTLTENTWSALTIRDIKDSCIAETVDAVRDQRMFSQVQRMVWTFWNFWDDLCKAIYTSFHLTIRKGYINRPVLYFWWKPQFPHPKTKFHSFAVFLLVGILLDNRRMDSATCQFGSNQRNTVCGFVEAVQFPICYHSW